jgi:tetratricopeptide (TPR) repeat protein
MSQEPIRVAEPPAQPYSIEGAALLEAGRAQDAIDVLLHGVAGGEPSAPDLLARAYLDSGSWRAAADFLAPLVEQGYVQFAGRMGVALAELGDWERAEEVLRLAVESGEIAAANDLAILLRDEGRLTEAVHVLEDAAAAGDLQAAANIVELHLEAGDVLSAMAAAEAYADERRPDTLVALADVRVQLGRFEEAESLYRRAGKLGALRAYTAYGQFLLAARGDAAAAERAFREAELHNEPGWAYTLGRFLLDEGRPDEARHYLQIAIDAGDHEAVTAMAELDGVEPDEL